MPLSSIARRAARTRSTARSKSWSGSSRIARGVLDGQPGDTGGRGQLHVVSDVLRIDREPALEVGVHRDAHGGRDDPQMFEHLIERDVIVRASQRPGEPGARRRQGLESHLLQRPRAPCIPGVRHDKATGGMQAAERLDSLVSRCHFLLPS